MPLVPNHPRLPFLAPGRYSFDCAYYTLFIVSLQAFLIFDFDFFHPEQLWRPKGPTSACPRNFDPFNCLRLAFALPQTLL
jgi:hypothetical protein